MGLKAIVGGATGGTAFTGSIAATQVAFGSGANAIAGSVNFTFVDGTALTIGNSTALRLSAGASGAPIIQLGGDTTTGFYRNTANQWTFYSAANATDDVTLLSSGVRLGSPGVYAWAVGGASSGTTDTGISRVAAASIAFGNGAAGDFTAAMKCGTLTVTAVAPAVSAGQVAFGSTTATTVGAAGGASTLPITPTGYLIFSLGATNFKLPYYAM